MVVVLCEYKQGYKYEKNFSFNITFGINCMLWRWFGGWYGWDRYNRSWGGKLDLNYDWTRRLSTGLSLRVLDNIYDKYDIMDGQTYSVNGRVSYSFDATKYMILHGGVSRDTAKDDVYANWRYDAGIGFGSELP